MKTETEPLKKAVYTIKHYNADEEFRMLAEAREEQLRSEKSAMSFWKKEGRAEGREEGLKEGLSKGIEQGIDKGRAEERITAIMNLISNGLDEKFIAKLGYTETEYSAAYEKLYPQIK